MAAVQIDIDNSIVPRLIAAMNGTFPEAASYDPAVAFKELTARYWRGILVEWEQREAEREAQRLNQIAIAAAKAKAETDAVGIA
jgi:hypothetical protein